MILMPIKAGEIVRENITLTVDVHLTGMRWVKVRFWLGAKIMKVASWVMGCGIEIKVNE